MILLHDFVLDHAHDLLCLLEAAMHHQPAWTFWNVAPHENDGQSKDRAHAKAESPADVYREEVGVEQKHRQASAGCRADPPGTVDREIHMATHTCRNELINCGVNGRVLPADACTCEEAAGGEPDKAEGEGRRDGGHKVDAQRNHEEHFPTIAVRHATEKQRSHHSAYQVGCAGARNLHGGEVHRLLFPEHTRDRTDDGDLKSIENPGNAQ